MIEELLINSDRVYSTSSKSGRCANLLKSAPQFISNCVLENSGILFDIYRGLVRESVAQVAEFRRGNLTMAVYNQTEFEALDVAQFDQQYSRVVYGANGEDNSYLTHSLTTFYSAKC